MPSSAARPEVVKLRELGDIVAAVPYFLGFRPEESLVAVALTGRRERLSFSMRLDLPDPGDHDQVVATVAERMQRAGAGGVLLFVYTARPPTDDGPLPYDDLVERLLRSLPMAVRDAVLVSGERVWSYVCAEPACCPREGRLLDPGAPGTVALAAANAWHGNAVLPDRASVVASVAPLGGIAAVSLDQALERAATAYAAVGPRAYRGSARALARQVVRRYAEPPAQLTDDEAAQLVVALHDISLRDELIGWAREDEGAMHRMALDLARRALPPLDPPACTLLAWLAYLHGDGVVVAAALDRALASDPDYSLAHLLGDALERQVTPDVLRRMMTEAWPAPKARTRSGRSG